MIPNDTKWCQVVPVIESRWINSKIEIGIHYETTLIQSTNLRRLRSNSFSPPSTNGQRWRKDRRLFLFLFVLFGWLSLIFGLFVFFFGSSLSAQPVEPIAKAAAADESLRGPNVEAIVSLSAKVFLSLSLSLSLMSLFHYFSFCFANIEEKNRSRYATWLAKTDCSFGFGFGFFFQWESGTATFVFSLWTPINFDRPSRIPFVCPFTFFWIVVLWLSKRWTLDVPEGNGFEKTWTSSSGFVNESIIIRIYLWNLFELPQETSFLNQKWNRMTPNHFRWCD